jgi:hypothetical protein
VTVADPKMVWQTALSTTNMSLRIGKETGISHTYLYHYGRQGPAESIRLRLLDYFKGYSAIDLFGQIVPAGNTAITIICKRCHSTQVIKSGFYMGVQRYQCKECGCVFANDNAPLILVFR